MGGDAHTFDSPGVRFPATWAQGLVPLSPCGLPSPLYVVTDRYELIMPPAIKAP